jgi:hypothetical protein
LTARHAMKPTSRRRPSAIFRRKESCREKT